MDDEDKKRFEEESAAKEAWEKQQRERELYLDEVARQQEEERLKRLEEEEQEDRFRRQQLREEQEEREKERNKDSGRNSDRSRSNSERSNRPGCVQNIKNIFKALFLMIIAIAILQPSKKNSEQGNKHPQPNPPKPSNEEIDPMRKTEEMFMEGDESPTPQKEQSPTKKPKIVPPRITDTNKNANYYLIHNAVIDPDRERAISRLLSSFPNYFGESGLRGAIDSYAQTVFSEPHNNRHQVIDFCEFVLKINDKVRIAKKINYKPSEEEQQKINFASNTLTDKEILEMARKDSELFQNTSSLYVARAYLLRVNALLSEASESDIKPLRAQAAKLINSYNTLIVVEIMLRTQAQSDIDKTSPLKSWANRIIEQGILISNSPVKA